MIHPDDLQMVINSSNSTTLNDPVDYLPYRVRHKNGNYLYVVDQSRLTDIYGGVCWQSILVDVTELMVLRNRMRLLEKYSTDCIIFIHDVRDPSTLEIVTYGLNTSLGIDEEIFRREMADRTMTILDQNGLHLYDRLLSHFDDPSVLNGIYTLTFSDGKKVRVNMWFNRIRDSRQDVQCIVTISVAGK